MFEIDDLLKTKYRASPETIVHPKQIMVYGKPGGGKTHFALTSTELPHVKSVLYLDTEGSTVGTAASFDPDKVTIVNVDSHENPLGFFETVVRQLEKGTSFDVVVVDAFDVVQDWKEAAIRATPEGQKDSWAVYRELGPWTVRILRKLKTIGKLSIVVIHNREEKRKDGSLIDRFRLVGDSKNTAPGIPDTVAYLEQTLDENNQPLITAHFISGEDKVVKNRFGLPVKMDDPSLPKVWSHIEERRVKNSESN